MWVLFVNNVLPIVGTLALGFIGWVVAHFFASPILKFYRLREAVYEELFFTDNISDPKNDKELYFKAVDDLRRLAARLEALYVSMTIPVRWIMLKLGYDPMNAARGLTGLSNSLSDKSGGKAFQKHSVQKGLKFPLSYSAEKIKKILDRQ